jgi:hypothetical protein
LRLVSQFSTIARVEIRSVQSEVSVSILARSPFPLPPAVHLDILAIRRHSSIRSIARNNPSMISRKDVPKYLHTSDFYRALVDDYEAIMIPKDCFVANDRVNSADDLTLLLSTLRFWGASAIPGSVVKFTVWNKPTAVINAFTEVQNELRYVQFLEALCVGIAHAFAEEDAEDYYYGLKSRQWSSCGMKGAAEVCVIQYQYENGKTWDSTTCMLVAQFGLLGALTFLHEHGCPWDAKCCAKAAAAGSLECLAYAHTHGCPWDSDTCAAAAHADNLPCLQYAHEHGCDLEDKTFAAALKGNACMEYLRLNDCPRGRKSCMEAVERLCCLQRRRCLQRRDCDDCAHRYGTVLPFRGSGS